jgi:hypothetical protein
LAGKAIARVPQSHSPEQANPSTQHFIDVGQERVVVRFGRKVTARDIATYADHLRAHPSFDPKFSEIIDLTAAEELDLGSEDFLTLADKVDPFSVEAKRAFVVRTSTQTHAARMHKILRTTRNIEIFRSFDADVRWIEI